MYPRLVIHHNTPSEYESPQNIHVRFVVLLNDAESQELPCDSEDLIAFCSKLYYNNFVINCFGEGSASMLEYDWACDVLIVHRYTSHPTRYISVTMDNISDITALADPKQRKRCILY